MLCKPTSGFTFSFAALIQGEAFLIHITPLLESSLSVSGVSHFSSHKCTCRL